MRKMLTAVAKNNVNIFTGTVMKFEVTVFEEDAAICIRWCLKMKFNIVK